MATALERFAFAFVACALGALPAACSSGGGASAVPVALDGTRTVSSGGITTGGGGTGGGGGTAKAPAPGFLAFNSGCGAIDSVTSASTANPPFGVTITTKVAEHNCVNVFFAVEWINANTGVVEHAERCFNFTRTPYTCSPKFLTAAPNTVYQTHVFVWNADLANQSPGTFDPAWILADETLTTTTAGAAGANQGG